MPPPPTPVARRRASDDAALRPAMAERRCRGTVRPCRPPEEIPAIQPRSRLLVAAAETRRSRKSAPRNHCRQTTGAREQDNGSRVQPPGVQHEQVWLRQTPAGSLTSVSTFPFRLACGADCFPAPQNRLEREARYQLAAPGLGASALHPIDKSVAARQKTGL